MGVTVGGVYLDELVNDYTESYDIQGGPSCRKGYICDWPLRFKAAHGFLGLSTVPALGGLINLVVPRPFPELSLETSNAVGSMFARTVEIRGAGPPTQGSAASQWVKAILYVTYGPFPWTFDGIDYMQLDPARPYVWCEQHFTYSSEYITIPKAKVFYKSNPTTPLAADWGFTSPKLDMSITLKNIPYLPAQGVLNALQAPINKYSYLGVNPGYLLFNGAEDIPAHSSDGTPLRDVALSFSYRPIAPWDYVYNGAIPGWDQVVDSGGNPIIQRSDLSTIVPSAYQA